MSHLELHVLGPFQAALDGEPITTFESDKVRALLAYLAVEGHRPHARTALAGLLWPDCSDSAALGNLRHALSNLRAAVRGRQSDPPLVHVTRDTLQFNLRSDCTLDCAALLVAAEGATDALERAIAAYRGPLLEGLFSDSAAFEEWMLLKREHFRQRALAALHQLADLHEQQGQHAQAASLARRAIELEPWEEESHQQLMRALARSGRRGAALGQYEACRRLLSEQLGVEPSPETTALRDAIRDNRLSEIAPPSERREEESPLFNLPIPLSSFVGRVREMAELQTLLPSLQEHARLVTLTGAAGCGKTRLALQVSHRLARQEPPSQRPYRDGVVWVELASLAPSDSIPRAVASALGLHESTERPTDALVLEHLRARDMLLVLDNCEHLVAACARLAQALMQTCPRLHILATSREALGVPGELVWMVHPLGLPDLRAKCALTAERLLQSDAVALFIERAAAVAPRRELAEDVITLAHICSRLDGIPLAIELAAARLKLLSAEQLAARLDDRFGLLTDGGRTALPHHRTLRAAIDWSHDLLSAQERALFRRLAVFSGGFALEAAEQACADGEALPDGSSCVTGSFLLQADLLGLMTALMDKSLIAVERHKGGVRHRMLETVREYASEKLTASGEAQDLRERHARYLLHLAEEAGPKVCSAEGGDWAERLDTEHDNLRAAWLHVLQSDVHLALRMLWALLRFWETRGHLSEGQEWASALARQTADGAAPAAHASAVTLEGWMLAQQEDMAARPLLEKGLALASSAGDARAVAWALSGLAECAVAQGDMEAGCSYSAQALEASRDQGDTRVVAAALHRLGMLDWLQGRPDQGRPWLEQAAAAFREAGDLLGLAHVENTWGEQAREQGDYRQAAERYEQCLRTAARVRDRSMQAFVQYNLAHAVLHEGDVERARTLFQDALESGLEQGYRDLPLSCLAGLACVLVAKAQHREAVCLFAAAFALEGEGKHEHWSKVDQEDHARYLALAHDHLDPAAFASAQTEGRAMTWEQALAHAQQALQRATGPS